MDYSDQDFTKLKYTDAYLLLIQRDQFHLDSHTDLISTWLHPVTFYHWIRNLDGLVLKYSELFISHRGGLRSEGYLYPYPSRATLDRECSTHGHDWCECTPTFYLNAITVSPYFLIKRIINSYSTQWPTSWYRYRPSNSISFGREYF